MEALILAGGKAERLGDAAGGLPKPLVPVAGRPLAAYQVDRLVAAGVDRIVVACQASQGALFEEALSGLGAEIVTAPESEPLGRGGGLRNAATYLRARGPVFALNGDELTDVDFAGLLEHHQRGGGAATIVVAPLTSAFGVVDLDGDVVVGFSEAPRLPYWVNCGIYVLGEETLARLPERGDHERSTFPELAAEGKLRALRHEGVWLTVNTPKDLRVAEEFVSARSDRPGVL
ncbi:MAG: NDP-sugar synthase [Gaiellales bacterium]